MITEARDPRMREIVDDEARLDLIADGFRFLEGPVWHPINRYLIFSDIVADRMHRWSSGQNLAIFRAPSGMANGNTYDRLGRLLTCEHATSRVSRTGLDGVVTVLADHFGDFELNSPNDIVVRSDGSIYFTDPTFGRTQDFGVLRKPELLFQGVYRIDPAGELSVLKDDFVQPNGLCFSRDEKLLFVNDSNRSHIRVLPVLPTGRVGSGSVWASVEGDGDGLVDGLKLDAAGNVYCCGPGGIHIFDPDGTALGVIRIPQVTANFTWGEEDMKTIFICASTSLYRLRTNVPGSRLF